MIDLYYWPTPNGHKITIALEEMGLPYTLHYVDISKGDQFKPEFLRFSPNNKMPAIIDQDGIGGMQTSIFESGAILLYLSGKTGKYIPSDMTRQVLVWEWLMWQMAGFGPMLGQVHHFNHYAPVKIDYAIERYVNEASRLYGVLDTQLSKGDYVTGDDYTIADMAILPWTKSYARQGIALEKFPNIARWRETLHNRKAVQKAYEIGAEIGEKNKTDLRELSGEEWQKLFGTTKPK